MKNWKNNITINDYYRYAIFHKSEEGSSIDLSESEYSTRIVSCHASKGDGRKVVFIISFNESAIKRILIRCFFISSEVLGCNCFLPLFPVLRQFSLPIV